MPEADDMIIGIYGQWHLQFLQQHRRAIHISILTSRNLNQYLAEIDRQAQERFFQMVEQMKQVQGITEQLKANFIENKGEFIDFWDGFHIEDTYIEKDRFYEVKSNVKRKRILSYFVLPYSEERNWNDNSKIDL